MEAGVPSAKKPRRLPDVLVAAPPSQSMVGLLKSKQQQPLPQQMLPPPIVQPFQFQQPQQERKRSMAPPQPAPIYHFYQQQMHRIPSQHPAPQPPQPQQQSQPQPRRIHQHHHKEFHVVESDRETTHPAASANPPWALPVSLTMPLHPISSTGYGAMAPAPPTAAPAPPVRRGGSKRAAASPAPAAEDWRFSSVGGGTAMNFMTPPPPQGSTLATQGGFLVSPASFAGPISVSVGGGAQRMGSAPSPRTSPPVAVINNNAGEFITPARAAAIEKRRLKLKQVSAAYHSEFQSYCEKLLHLQRECREEIQNPCVTREEALLGSVS